MVKCNNPKCGAKAEGKRYTICRKCGFVMYPMKNKPPKTEKQFKEFRDGN
jgi:hypothetical protein